MSFVRAFLDRLAPRPAPVSSSSAAALEHALHELVERARAAWPRLNLDPNAFVQHIAVHLPADVDPMPALSSLHAEELWIAFGCHEGDRRAMVDLERAYGAHIDAAYRVVPHHLLSRDDYRQQVRDALFVADLQGRTKIGMYAGHGSLAAWLRITARRIGLNAVRGAAPPGAGAYEDPFELPASLGDPELDYLKDTYREQFREAFVHAVAALPARERTLLRQSVTHGLTVRQLGRMHQVHHATAARWVADARQRLVDDTRAALQQRLDVSRRELDSIMGLIASRLDVSVARVLGPED